jgi:hypothetical protein
MNRAIVALDAETPAITCVDLLVFPVALDDDESQPLAQMLAGIIRQSDGEKNKFGGL